MSPEYQPTEKLILASKVNKLCSIDDPTMVDESIIEDSQFIINSLHQKIETSGSFIDTTWHTPSQTFGGLMSTNAGNVESQVKSDGEKKKITLGKNIEERIGLYKVSVFKESNDENSLNFEYFWTEVDKRNMTLAISPSTHLLFNSKNNQLNAIIKQYPISHELFSFHIITFQEYLLWGKGNLKNTSFKILG